MNMPSRVIRLLLCVGAWTTSHAFAPPGRTRYLLAQPLPTASQYRVVVALSSNPKDDDAWDDDSELVDALAGKSPSNGSSNNPGGKLGIPVLLDPLSEKEAGELKAAATELINDAVAAGIDDLRDQRDKMTADLEKQRQRSQAQSEAQAKVATKKLMNKIDALTDNFLAETGPSRKSTKLAAAADRQVKGGGGVEMGSWGVLGQTDVVMTGDVATTSSRSSSSDDTDAAASDTPSALAPKENRILILADTKQDKFAKQLIDPLTKALQTVVSDLQVDVFAPTATLPLGGQNAAAVLIFLTSLSDATTVKNGMDRLLRKTLQADGKIAQPPSQFVAISTIGTERTDKMPYSMQNLLGGKLDKRRQMEEAVINVVNQRFDPPFCDYTICKLGELKPSVSAEFGLKPGDSLDGDLETEAAVQVLQQAIALQLTARNATLSVVGGSAGMPSSQDEWDEAFVAMAGPEVWRQELVGTTPDQLGRLIEYLHEWANLPESSKALTTPIRVVTNGPTGPTAGVVEQSVMQFLFLPTATGSRYVSRDEERSREQENRSGGASGGSIPTASSKTKKEGGLEFLIEVTRDDKVRVRARRCNYAPGVILKEMTEETILARIKKVVTYWNEQGNKAT